MSSGVLTYDKVAVEQVFQLALWKHHRTTTHRVGDEVEGVDVGEAVPQPGVVEEAEDAPVAATQPSEAASQRADARELVRAANRAQMARSGAVPLYPRPGTRCKPQSNGRNANGAVPLYPEPGTCC